MSGKPRSRRSLPKRSKPVSANEPPAAVPVAPEVPPEKLTPEEQMERFAQELKNEDWGHQPC